MEINFLNQTVLITGASQGIGRATAFQMAESGARVAIHYNTNKQLARETLDMLPGGPHMIVQANQSSLDDLDRMVEETIDEMGQINMLVNNAAIYDAHPIDEVNLNEWQEVWERTLRINLMGPARLIFSVAEHMKKNEGGKMINISSRGVFRGEPKAPAYAASKGGLNAMSQSLAQALAPHNIFIYVIAPGFVETEMASSILSGPSGDSIRNQSPLKRVAKPEEVARTVVLLASEGTEFLTGGIIDINGASYLRA